jgi:Brp/Blh family beta-carotene 15,15'-monooxygenase
MVKALQIQGLAFSITALLVSALSVGIGRPDEQTELIVLGVLILLLGVPHGALDTIFAHRLYGIRTPLGWIGFVALYLLLAAAVVAFWVVAPAGFLLGFLVISAAHFSGDPAEGTPLPVRILQGGGVLILPALLHEGEMGRLFALLAGQDAAGTVMPLIRLLAWIWLPCVLLTVILRARRDRLGALETGSIALLSVAAPPLVSFTLFFCGMHSARHILRTIEYSGHSSTRLLVGAALLPMTGVLIASGAAWHFLEGTPLDVRLVQIVFVGLAALTVPHMALIERVRISGWLKGAVTKRDTPC